MKRHSKIKFITCLLLFPLLVLLTVSPALAGRHRRSHPHGRKDFVWEPAAETGEGKHVPGFWRPAFRRGYVWIKAGRDEAGRWHPGYWKPIGEHAAKAGTLVWVPGYRLNSRWVTGYWRRPEKEGHIWVEGYFDLKGRWHEPHWHKELPY